MSQSSDRQGEFAQLSQEYAARLLKTVTEINQTWQKLCNINWDDDAFSSLQTAVHKLAGTAKNYGYDEVGQRALMLDQLFRKIDKTEIPTEAEKQQIKALLAELTQLSGKPADSTVATDLPQATLSNTTDLVYIVDDDDDASRYFQVILNSAGYITETFSNLADFHRALDSKRPDLIIMDIVFPEGKLAGIDAINQLGTELGINIPIIFISARSDVQARIRALRAGGCAYITKPVEPDVMLSVVVSNSSVEQTHRRIVVIDDDPVALNYLEALMKANHYEVMSSENPTETLQAIESFRPDVVVMDYNMPGYNGEELVRMLRQDKRYLNLPVIMVTGDDDPEVEARVRRLRNTCFLKKPINNKHFLETIAESIREACRSKKIMLDVLKQHPLGLLNLYYFYSELESIIASDNDTPYTLLYFAIDEPVSIRERVGLKNLVDLNNKISRYLLSLVGKNELVSQLTEFVYLVLIQIDDQSNLKASIDSLKDRMKSEVFTVDDISIAVKTSIGAVSISSEIKSVDEAIRIVEHASIEANKDGGDKVCIEIPGRVNIGTPKSDIERAFITAFNDDNLRLQYQPIVNINTSESIYEAFARFVDGERVITPGQFMPYVQEYNLEFDFNKKLVITALNMISGPDDALHVQKKNVVIIKLEPGHGAMVKFMDWFEEYMDTHQVRAHDNLIFSFHEKWVLKNHDNYKRFMKQTQKYRCGLALDHAGISRYSVDLIEAIEPAFVKLSPKFTEQLLSHSPGNTHAVLTKLQATDSCIVASSVENSETFSKLMALGIHCFQGYIVQHPETNLGFSISEHYI